MTTAIRGISLIVLTIASAYRSLKGRRALVLNVVGLLSLGIGTAAGVLGTVEALVLRVPPVRDPAALFFIDDLDSDAIGVEDLRSRTHGLFADVTLALRIRAAIGSGPMDQREVTGEVVSPEYWRALGLQPERGAGFAVEGAGSDRDRGGVVLSYASWRDILGAASDPSGSEIKVDGRSFRVAGVAPRGFVGTLGAVNPTDFWITADDFYGPSYKGIGGRLLARLAPGVSLAQARSSVSAMVDRNRSEGPARILPFSDLETRLGRGEAEGAKLAATTASTIALVVLCVAALNVSSLLAAQSIVREAETEIRSSLGATPMRLLTERGTEIFLLCGLSALCGAGCAVAFSWSVKLLWPPEHDVSVGSGPALMVFVALSTAMVGVLAYVASTHRLMAVTRGVSGSIGTRATHSRAVVHRVRYGLLIPQLALSIALGVVAVRYGRPPSDGHVRENQRFSELGAITVSFWGRAGGPSMAEVVAGRQEEYRALFRAALQRARVVEGVRSAAFATSLPTGASGAPRSFVTPGLMEKHGSASRAVFRGFVSDRYFETLGIQIVKGRDFLPEEIDSSEPLVIVSSNLARALWPASEPVGQLVGELTPHGTPPTWLRVVGVSEDLGSGAAVFRPLGGVPSAIGGAFPMELVVRADHLGLGQTLVAVRRELSSEPLARVTNASTIAERQARINHPRKVAGWLVAAAGLLGSIVAFAGLHSTLTFSLMQQRRSLAIRTMLGARPRMLSWHVARGMVLVLVLASLLATMLVWMADRTINSLIGGPGVSMPAAVGLVLAGVLVSSLLASAVPLVQARRLDVVAMLRE